MMRLNKSMLTMSAALILGFVSAGNAAESQYADIRSVSGDQRSNEDRYDIRFSVYASTGLGASRLTPDNTDLPSWTVSDDINAGGQITIGADINRHLSLELHSADLGSAGVEQSSGPLKGRINYHMHGGSVLWFAGKNRHNHKRQGFTGYGRFGFALMDNSAVGDAPFTQRNSRQLLIGAGLEYNTRIGLGVRAEVISFDTDAQYAQLGLIYRMGRKAERQPSRDLYVKSEVKPIPQVAAALPTPAEELDLDADGVVDSVDKCLSSKPSDVVDATGCSEIRSVLQGVNFYSGSERLTKEAKHILNGVAVTLKQYSGAKIYVNAHTDNQGSEDYNQDLSYRRAKMVVNYLSAQGVNRGSMEPAAFGETKPIASNDTAEGRLSNRRVELRVVQ